MRKSKNESLVQYGRATKLDLMVQASSIDCQRAIHSKEQGKGHEEGVEEGVRVAELVYA